MQFAPKRPNKMNSDSTPLSFGWIVTIRRAFSRYPKSALTLLGTGLLGSILEMLAFAIAVICIQVMQRQEAVTYFNFSLPYPLSLDTLIICSALFGGFMLLSALSYFYNGILLAKLRRRTFRDMIALSLEKFVEKPGDNFVTSQSSKMISRVLRRDCRYVSKATTDGLGLPKPIIVLTITFVLGFMYFTEVTSAIVIILLASVPLHIIVSNWGARNMSRLIDSGAVKSKADGVAIETLVFSPFKLGPEAAKRYASKHADSDEVQGFLRAYQGRVALVPTSVLVSRFTHLAIFLSVGVIMAIQWQRDGIDLAGIAILLIGIRFAAAATSEIAQIITVISSYSPLTNGLLSFVWSQQDGGSERLVELPVRAPGDDAMRLPLRIFLISDSMVSWPLAEQVSSLQGKQGYRPQIISGSFETVPVGHDVDVVRTALENEWANLSDALKLKVHQKLNGERMDDLTANSLIALKLLVARDQPTAVFWESKSFVGLSPADRRTVMRSLSNVPVTVVYNGVPKRIPNIATFQVWTLLNGELNHSCKAKNFLETRSEILTDFDSAKENVQEASIDLDFE